MKILTRMLLLFLLLPISAVSAAVIEPEITYKGEPGPVTFGVPFAQGAVRDAAKLNLDGKPLQVKVNGLWPDGSVKWALFDTDLPKNFKGKFTLGKAHSGAPLYREGVLANGKIKVTFPAQGPLFCYELPGEKGSARISTKFLLDDPGPCEGENWLKAAPPGKNYRTFSSDGKRTVSVETNGPQRAVVRIEGDAGYRYIVRVTLWKNELTLRVQTTFICALDPNENFLRSMVLKIDRPGKTVQRELVTGTPRFHHMVSWRKKTSPTASGVLHDGKLTVAVRDFARLFPKELSCDEKGVYFHIWPERSGKLLDLRRREKVDRRFLEYTNPAGGYGVAKTHDLYLSWSDPRIAERINKIELPAASPEYMRSTLACGEYLLPGNGFPKCDALLNFSFKYLHEYKRQGHFDGMMDWGDIPLGAHGLKDHMNQGTPESAPFRGYTGWSNGDFAMAASFYLHFLRTGDQDVLRDGLDFTWHLADVDTVHYWPKDKKYSYSPGANYVGLGRRHDQQHWGTFPLEYGYVCDDGIYAYLLTGEERILEVLKLVGANYNAYYGRFMALRLYEITGEQRFLKRFRRDMERETVVPRSDNFRSNSYDAPGYIFVESIMPGVLKEKVLAGVGKYAVRYHSAVHAKHYPPWIPAVLACKYAPVPENFFTLKAMLFQLRSYLDADYTLPRNNSMEEYDKKWKCPNLPVASLFFWLSLPYVMDTLHRAGITEKECLTLKYKWEDFPSRTEVLKNSSFKKTPWIQHCHYTVPLSKQIFRDWGLDKDLDDEGKIRYRLALKRMKLYEDGKLLGPGVFAHALIMKNGLIGWSSLGWSLMMTASDKSDPCTNGRKYVFEYTSEKDWKWQDKPSFDEKLVKIYPYPDISKVSGTWCAVLNHESPDPVLVFKPSQEVAKRAAAALKRHKLTEDGKVLKNWRRNQNIVIFTVPDGSDPRTNKREYRFTYKSEKDM